MKELIAVIILLMLFSSARGEAPAYFNKGEHALEAEWTEQAGDTYVVGVDLQEGMYTFIADETCQGTLTITNWDGSISQQCAVEPGWVDTLRIYNEQTVSLPAGCQVEFNLSFASSGYDTGSRQLNTQAPGIYTAGKELAAGLYIVQNENTPAVDVCIRDAGGAVIRKWSLMSDSYYTIYLQDGWSVEIGEGCLLRSMTTKYIFQEGTMAVVPGSRYITGMQIPCRSYTFTGRDKSSMVHILNLATGEETLMPLSAGEAFTLEAGEELLVEMINVEVRWEQGIG